jgi:hypothetical protein
MTDTLMVERGDLRHYAVVVEYLCQDALDADLTREELRALIWAIAACADTGQVGIVRHPPWFMPEARIVRGLRGLAKRGLLAFRETPDQIEVQMLPPDHWFWRVYGGES